MKTKQNDHFFLAAGLRVTCTVVWDLENVRIREKFGSPEQIQNKQQHETRWSAHVAHAI